MRGFRILLCVFVFFLFAVQAVAQVPSAKSFGTLPSHVDAAISPDGKTVATFLNFNNSGEYVVKIIDIDGNEKASDGPFLKRGVQPAWLKWANDEILLVAIRLNMKADRNTPVVYEYLISYNVKSGDQKILVESLNNIRQFNANVLDFLENDPQYILMSVRGKRADNRGVELTPEVRKIDVFSGKAFRLQQNDPNVQNWILDRRNHPRVGQGITKRTRNKDDAEYFMTIRDTDTLTWRNVSEYPGLNPRSSIYGFTENPNELVVGQYRDQDTKGLYIYDLSQKAYTRKVYHNPKYDVSGLVYDSTGTKLIGAKYIADDEVSVIFDEGTQPSGPTIKETDRYDYVDSSQSGKFLYKVTSPSNPGDLVVYGPETHTTKTIGSIRPEFDGKAMGVVENITYPSRDNLDIPGYITYPPGYDKASGAAIPFIVLPHGGPYARTSRDFDYFAQFFATRGYGVLQMNFRGSTGYGKAFQDAGRENWQVMLDDVEDGTRWLYAQGLADPDKSCIAGWSYGGYAALMGAIKHPDLYNCAVSMAGVTDLKDLWVDIQRYLYGRSRAKNTILVGFSDKSELKENSPVELARDLEIPLYIAHGKLDQRVHYDQFSKMTKALRKSDAEVTELTLNGEDHFLSDQYNRELFFEGLDAFLVKVNGKLN